MKVKSIINAVHTYNDYQYQIKENVKKRQMCDAFDDEWGVAEYNKKINEINKELGRFLDSEV